MHHPWCWWWWRLQRRRSIEILWPPGSMHPATVVEPRAPISAGTAPTVPTLHHAPATTAVAPPWAPFKACIPVPLWRGPPTPGSAPLLIEAVPRLLPFLHAVVVAAATVWWGAGDAAVVAVVEGWSASVVALPSVVETLVGVLSRTPHVLLSPTLVVEILRMVSLEVATW